MEISQGEVTIRSQFFTDDNLHQGEPYMPPVTPVQDTKYRIQNTKFNCSQMIICREPFTVTHVTVEPRTA